MSVNGMDFDIHNKKQILNSNENLDEYQLAEVKLGAERGLDVLCYAKPEYMAIQMRQIRLGLENGLDVSVYAKPEYDWFQMEEIRLGMEEGVDYELYAKPSIDYKRMRQLRIGLRDGIDLSSFVKLDAGILEELRKAIKSKVSITEYIKEGYVVEQLTEIRIALEKKLDIRPYINTEYRGASIREIALGLEADVAVERYANTEYQWQQMREIRLGMEARVDVDQYSNELYSWQQMRELRLGLEEGLEIEGYKKFLYTATVMEQMRKNLLLEEARGIADQKIQQQLLKDEITIFISKDEMEACIEVSGKSDITAKDILQKLKQSGISQGILQNEVESIITEKRFGQTIVIARGKTPEAGKDGWYEFFFDTNPCRKPNILEDGTADFSDVKWFELVEKNQKIAYYHSAEYGISGYTVTGKFLKAKKGHEKSVLRGHGFHVLEDKKTYISLLDGRIICDEEGYLEVSRVCALDAVNRATGNISFDGTIYIHGNVGSGVTISATENIIVDGFVEAAVLRSGGEIFLRRGANGGGNGIIEAKENVVGQFFEDVQIIAGGDIIISQYCMNCNLFAQGTISLMANKGLLLGGMARALKGISAYIVGNKMGLRTVLHVGIDQQTVNGYQKILNEIENVNRELKILQHSQNDFQNKYAPEVRNTMEIYLKIEDAIYTKNLQLDQLIKEKEALEEYMEEMRKAKVVVSGILYEGTEVAIGSVKWKAFDVKDVVLRCVNDKVIVESN